MATITSRKTDNGKIRYRVQVRLRGFPPETATFERKTDAKKWAQQVEAAIREGRYFKTAEARRHTVGELIDRYLAEVLPTKPRSIRMQSTQLNWWRNQIGYCVLADVAPALIAEHRDKLARGNTPTGDQRSPATVNRYLAALSHAFTIAVKEWGWLEDSPMRKIRKYREPRERVRFLSDDERDCLLRACKESRNRYLYSVVMLALSTGARKMEIMNLKWDDVDLRRGAMIVHDTKNSERRTLPLAGRALEMLKDMSKVRRIGASLLFPGHDPRKPVDLRASWEAALKKAGIEDFRFHDLRHSAASYLAMNGASLAEIADVLGHKTLQMVKRYAHLSEQHTASVVARMNKKIFG